MATGFVSGEGEAVGHTHGREPGQHRAAGAGGRKGLVWGRRGKGKRGLLAVPVIAGRACKQGAGRKGRSVMVHRRPLGNMTTPGPMLGG